MSTQQKQWPWKPLPPYTPGTWEVVHFAEKPPAIFSGDEVVAYASAYRYEYKQNARLISAAPELLAALEKEEEWRGREAAGELDPEWDYELMVGQYRRAAIAKATGEAS
jgi:hypothetical protein